MQYLERKREKNYVSVISILLNLRRWWNNDNNNESFLSHNQSLTNVWATNMEC